LTGGFNMSYPKKSALPLNKPIPDHVISYWKKEFKDFQSKFSKPKKAN
tara:strand:+ start:444 stop:587 length:144 start_codon:yes stop_codon:yes gene_type:complete